MNISLLVNKCDCTPWKSGGRKSTRDVYNFFFYIFRCIIFFLHFQFFFGKQKFCKPIMMKNVDENLYLAMLHYSCLCLTLGCHITSYFSDIFINWYVKYLKRNKPSISKSSSAFSSAPGSNSSPSLSSCDERDDNKIIIHHDDNN